MCMGKQLITFSHCARKHVFSKDQFKRVSRPDVTTLILVDDEEILSLNYNIDGLIITADLSKDCSLTVEKVQEMYIYIANAIMPLTDAKDKIMRLGTVYEFEIPDFTDSAATVFSKFMKLPLTGYPDETLMRLSLKHPSMGAVIDPAKKADYNNVILTISSEREKDKAEKGDEDEEVKQMTSTILKVIVDYQQYYIPQKSHRDINMKGHFAQAKSYIHDHIKTLELSTK